MGARQRIILPSNLSSRAPSRIEEIERRDRENAEAEARRRKFAEMQTALAKAGTVKPDVRRVRSRAVRLILRRAEPDRTREAGEGEDGRARRDSEG